jgi:hypothetical protein
MKLILIFDFKLLHIIHLMLKCVYIYICVYRKKSSLMSHDETFIFKSK